MKVLWFTNTLMPEVAARLGRSPEVIGGWMPALLDGVRRRPGIELAVATMVPPSLVGTHVVNGVTYLCLPEWRRRWNEREVRSLFATWSEAIARFAPDVIHVHGTEELYAHFTALGGHERPAVVSIQGLVHVYARHVTGGVSLRDALGAGVPGLLSWLRFHELAWRWRARGVLERERIRGNVHFVGRTAWDEAHVRAVNPGARYHHCDEVLRPEFRERAWTLEGARRRSVFCTAAHTPLKGFHVLLEAVASLREEFPDLEVRVAGAPWNEARGFGYYGRYLKALVDRLGLARTVVPLPSLGAGQVAEELSRAHAFVIPSLVENSPNSLAEAMLVGTPCVASLVGGIPSMIRDGETALGFPSGDAACVAHCLRRIFTDDALARRLSRAASAVASARHDRDSIVTAQLEIYQELLSAHQARSEVA